MKEKKVKYAKKKWGKKYVQSLIITKADSEPDANSEGGGMRRGFQGLEREARPKKY